MRSSLLPIGLGFLFGVAQFAWIVIVSMVIGMLRYDGGNAGSVPLAIFIAATPTLLLVAAMMIRHRRRRAERALEI